MKKDMVIAAVIGVAALAAWLTQGGDDEDVVKTPPKLSTRSTDHRAAASDPESGAAERWVAPEVARRGPVLRSEHIEFQRVHPELADKEHEQWAQLGALEQKINPSRGGPK